MLPEFVTGLDGKHYPRRRKWSRQRTAAAVHRLAHGGRSVRQVQAALLAEGLRASVGTVHAYLAGWTCPNCSGVRNDAPEQLLDGAPQ